MVHRRKRPRRLPAGQGLSGRCYNSLEYVYRGTTRGGTWTFVLGVLGRSSARANNSTGDVTSIPETTSGRRRLYAGTVTAVSESGLMYFESLLLATQ